MSAEENVTGAVGKRRTALVQGHRMLLHDPAVDRYISPSLAATGLFEPFETELLLNEIRPGDMVVDVGANIGYYTLLFARRVGPHGKVFAFEPEPGNFELLRHNIALNGYGNVVLSRQAVSDRNGPGRLFLSGINQGDHRLHDLGEGRAAVAVETVTLDCVFGGVGRVDLVKMDIQGGECAALEGMRGLLGRLGHVKLVTEFWPRGLQAAGGSAARYLTLLRELGFRLSQISEAQQALVGTSPERLLSGFTPRGTTSPTCCASRWAATTIRKAASQGEENPRTANRRDGGAIEGRDGWRVLPSGAS